MFRFIHTIATFFRNLEEKRRERGNTCNLSFEGPGHVSVHLPTLIKSERFQQQLAAVREIEVGLQTQAEE